MKRLDLWRAKLIAAKAQKRIVLRQLNILERKHTNLTRDTALLERQIARHLAKHAKET